jgi:hypothetical protein
MKTYKAVSKNEKWMYLSTHKNSSWVFSSDQTDDTFYLRKPIRSTNALSNTLYVSDTINTKGYFQTFEGLSVERCTCLLRIIHVIYASQQIRVIALYQQKVYLLISDWFSRLHLHKPFISALHSKTLLVFAQMCDSGLKWVLWSSASIEGWWFVFGYCRFFNVFINTGAAVFILFFAQTGKTRMGCNRNTHYQSL